MKLILTILTFASLVGCKTLTMNMEETRQYNREKRIQDLREEYPNVEKCADIATALTPYTKERFHLSHLDSYGTLYLSNIDEKLAGINNKLVEAEQYVSKVQPDLDKWKALHCSNGAMSVHIWKELEYRSKEKFFMGGNITEISSLERNLEDIEHKLTYYRSRVQELKSPIYREELKVQEIAAQKAASKELHSSGYLDDISPYSSQETGPRYARCYYMSEFLGFTNTHFVTWALRTMDKAYFKRQLDFVNKYLTDVSPVTEEKRLDKAGRYFGRYCR